MVYSCGGFVGYKTLGVLSVLRAVALEAHVLAKEASRAGSTAAHSRWSPSHPSLRAPSNRANAQETDVQLGSRRLGSQPRASEQCQIAPGTSRQNSTSISMHGASLSASGIAEATMSDMHAR